MAHYRDDFVVCFQYREAAERFLQDLRARLKKFGLCLHPDKTRLIEFGRFAERDRRKRNEGRPKMFDFLGFTHYCRKTRKGGFGLGRKPIAKRMACFVKRIHNEAPTTDAPTGAPNGSVVWAGTQRMAELLCHTMEYAVSTAVLQVPEMDLVASTTSTLPAGPNDMGATEPVSRTVLAETENPTRLAGKTIYRHARRCNLR